MPKNWDFPIILKVAQPMRRLQQWWSRANRCVSQTNTIRCITVSNLLVKVRGSEDTCAGRRCIIEIDCVDLNGSSDVFKVLPTKFAAADRNFPLNLIENLARNTNASAVSNAF